MEIRAQATSTFSDTHQTKPSFVGIVRSELTKITWLRSTWIITMLIIVLTTFIYMINAQNGRSLLKSNPIEYTYEFTLGENFLLFRVLTGYFALLITVFVVGLDYQFGTIRVILGRGVGRIQFLLGKIVALFIFAILVQIGGIILNGILMSAQVGMETGNLSAMGVILPHLAGIFAQYFLYLIFNMWVSILLATFVSVIGRSLTFGMTVALIWFPFDNTIATLLERSRGQLPGDIGLKVATYLLGPNLNRMPSTTISQQISSGATSGISGIQTIVVALVYASIFLAVAIVLTQRRDVQS